MGHDEAGQRKKFIPVTGAVVLALVVAGLIWLASAYHTRSTYDAEHRAQNYAESAQDRIERACRGVEPTAVLECVAIQIEATREYQRAEYDLSAQERMANWALWALGAAILTVALTALALWFVKGTLDATRATLAEAAATTAAAKDTVAETKIANAIAQQQFAAQYLPRVHITAHGPLVQSHEVKSLDPGEQRQMLLMALVEIENLGNEHLTLIKAGVAAVGVDSPAPIDIARNTLIKPGHKALIGWRADQEMIDLGPQPLSVGIMHLTEENRADFMAHGVILKGVAVYTNILNETFEHRFAFRADAPYIARPFPQWGGAEENSRRKIG